MVAVAAERLKVSAIVGGSAPAVSTMLEVAAAGGRPPHPASETGLVEQTAKQKRVKKTKEPDHDRDDSPSDSSDSDGDESSDNSHGRRRSRSRGSHRCRRCSKFALNKYTQNEKHLKRLTVTELIYAALIMENMWG